MNTYTVLPAPAGLRGIIVCEDDRSYDFHPLAAMAVEQTNCDEFFAISYICLDGCVADWVVDSSDFVHDTCANLPLTQWEVENNFTRQGRGVAV